MFASAHDEKFYFVLKVLRSIYKKFNLVPGKTYLLLTKMFHMSGIFKSFQEVCNVLLKLGFNCWYSIKTLTIYNAFWLNYQQDNYLFYKTGNLRVKQKK